MSLIKALILGVSITFAAANAHADEPTQTEKNKATVVAFYNKALNDKDAEAAIALMGPTYTQHNAHIADGKEGFRQFIAAFKQKYPQSHSSIVHVFDDGDYVILHVHLVREPGTRGEAVMDIFRLDKGKLVEHWDVLQPIPENIPHSNTMF